MSVKVYREGKDVEVYKTTNEEIDETEYKEMSEAEEEAKEFEEVMKLQLEMERMKQEEPERYAELVKQNKQERRMVKIFLIWFFGSIVLMLVFAGMEKGALMLSVFGHYFAVFGFMAYMKNKDEQALLSKLVPIIFMLFGSTFMIGCILYQFGIISF